MFNQVIFLAVIIVVLVLGFFVFKYLENEQAKSTLSDTASLENRISFAEEEMGVEGIISGKKVNLESEPGIKGEFLAWVGKLTPIPDEKAKEALNKAGYRTVDAHAVFFTKRFCKGLLVGFMVSLSAFFGLGSMGLLTGGILGFLVFMQSNGELRKKIAYRSLQIDKTLPDVIDLFANCCKAGVSFDVAATFILNELGEEESIRSIKEDLLSWQNDISLGLDRTDCWKRLANRSDSKNIRYFCSLINQSEKVGGSVSEALFKMSDFFRDRRIQQIEAEIAQLPSKMSGQTILFIVMPIIVMILLPIVINAFTTIKEVF